MQELRVNACSEMLRRLERVCKKFADDTFRQNYMAQMLRVFLGAQIRALRGDQSQTAFGRTIDKPQSVVSRLESADYGKATISTLVEIAERLKLALIIRFVDFPTFMQLTQSDSDETLRPASYTQEGFEAFVATATEPTKEKETAESKKPTAP